MKKTKVICTLGPSSENKRTIKALIKAGMNAARLNFSHGTYEQFKNIINLIREVSIETKVPIAIIQDLQGPKIRIGKIPSEGIKISKGEKFVIHTGKTYEEIKQIHFIPIQYKDLPKDIEKGHPILIDDGKIELEVLSVNKAKGQINVKAKNRGLILSNKGINVPKTNLRTPALTKKDKADLKFGIKMNVDYVALSFVRKAEDIKNLKKLIGKKDLKIISKIERPEAMTNLSEIVEVSDSVMIARGDLGIEIPAENVPIAQKRIIKEANRQGKPVITATHVLNSMVESPVPTRAEISDASNAIFDNTDAIMLSNETAIGAYPVRACGVLASVAKSTESEISKHEIELNNAGTDVKTIEAVTLNAVELADDIKAKYIVALTKSGYTAMQIAKNRPRTEIIVFTKSKKCRDQLALVWGLNKIYLIEKLDFENPINEIKTFLKSEKLIKKTDEVVVCNAVKNGNRRLITTF